MKVEVKDAGSCRKELHVSVDGAGIADDYQDILKQISKVAKVPGFRKGKAPLDVIEKRFSESIEEEAKDRLVPRFYQMALEQEGVKPVAIVSVSDVAFAKESGIAFDVTVDVAPDFKLPKYKKISLKRKPATVEDSEIDSTVERLRESAARYEDVEGRAVRKDDLIQVDYKGTIDGKPVSEMAPDNGGIGDGEDFWVVVGEPELLPGFADAVAGMTLGESREINIRFPDDYRLTAIGGMDAVYQVSIKGIREKRLAELDEAFLKQFEVESEEALRARIREDLQANAERNEDARLKGEIAGHLLKKTSFDIPQSVVEQETQAETRSMVQRMAMGGATREQIEGQRDDIVKNATEASTDRVKVSYILDRIADEEDISVEESDVEARIGLMAQRYQMPVEQMKAELEKRNGIEGIRGELRSEKTLDFLLENAKVK